MKNLAHNAISYHFLDGDLINTDKSVLDSCAKLYSGHYGVWGKKSENVGSRVKLSAARIKAWLDGDNTVICYATDGQEIVGYAIALSMIEPAYGTVTWITQLVVHEEYRNRGIAKNILLSIWGFSDHTAWGIVSANPYAVRALEKITHRRAVPDRIKRDITKLRDIGIKHVCFINADTEFTVNEHESKVNTEFFVDHEDISQKISAVTNEEVAWLLGDIDEGWEWCAFTFQDQQQIPLSNEEIAVFLDTSDSIVKEAYSRMVLNSDRQKWMKNEVSEIQYLRGKIDFTRISFAYDLGCGIGRHAIILAKIGIETVGVDYVESNIERATKTKDEMSLSNVSFVHADCRTYRSDRKAALVLCLYDVVGTFVSNEENAKIITTAYELLESGGHAVFSVMNYESTAFHAENKFKFSKSASKILEIKPLNIMEKTGNVFSPKYNLVDEETHVVYRKEQFFNANNVPRELIVRDRRFTESEIVEMCVEVGFTVIEAKYVNATDWKVSYTATDKKAKEILLICKKL